MLKYRTKLLNFNEQANIVCKNFKIQKAKDSKYAFVRMGI
jgi:hypothetical protein